MALAALRFAGAVAAGFIVLFGANLIMLFTGVGARWSGILLFAIPVIVLMAVRYAHEGQANAFDRTVGAAAAAVSAVAVAGFGVVALLGGGIVVGGIIVLISFAAPPDAASNLALLAKLAGAVSDLALFAAGALLYLAFRIARKKKDGALPPDSNSETAS